MTEPKVPTDRRVRRTRRLLRDALVNLILERGWDNVTVQDVCAEADVGRSTFYVHFADKEEALLSGFEELHVALAEIGQGGEAFAFLRPLVEHSQEHVKLFRAVVGRQSGPKLQARFGQVVFELMHADLGKLGVEDHNQQQTVLARFLCGGFIELLINWLDHPEGRPAAALSETFVQFAKGAIATCEPLGKRVGVAPSAAKPRPPAPIAKLPARRRP